MTEYSSSVVFSEYSPNTLVYLRFDLDVIASHLHGSNYTEYQHFLYETISDLRSKHWSYQRIANWLNENGYSTVRGKTFGSAHVHSILKKRLAKEALFKREYPEVWSDFSMEVVDKTILMSNLEFPHFEELEYIISMNLEQTCPPTMIANFLITKTTL